MPKTGATRHQKFLKSEKTKTKLKAKDLPRGTNITKTSFKVKKIVVKEQLKAHDKTEVVSKKNLNLKELINRLNHFSVNSITEGLNGLKELVHDNPQFLLQHLGELILGVSPLVIHVEKVVRQEAFKLMFMILSSCQTEMYVPFSDILCSYLRCAMTHINKHIQEDSLLFFDCLLQTVSESIVRNFHKILPSFMDMISKLKQDVNSGRMLTINTGSQLTSAKWRIKVLYRLQQYLSAYAKYRQSLNRCSDKHVMKVSFFDSNICNTFPLGCNISNLEVSCFASASKKDDVIEEEHQFKGHVEVLMSLLIDSWIEVKPNVTKKRGDHVETMIPEETAVYLKYFLDIITLILEHINFYSKDLMKWFCNTYCSSFNKNIIAHFPYSTLVRPKNDKNKNKIVFDDPITDAKMLNENIKVCTIFVTINGKISKQFITEAEQVFHYVGKVLDQKNIQANESALVKLLTGIFLSNTSTQDTKTVQILLDKIVNAYLNKTISASIKGELFSLLCKIVLESKDNKNKLIISGQFNLIICDMLCGSTISIEAIDALVMLATQTNDFFNLAVKPQLTSIISNLSKISIFGEHNHNARAKLYSLLYWVNKWDKKSFDILENELSQIVDKSMYKFVTDILKIKAHGVFSSE